MARHKTEDNRAWWDHSLGHLVKTGGIVVLGLMASGLGSVMAAPMRNRESQSHGLISNDNSRAISIQKTTLPRAGLATYPAGISFTDISDLTAEREHQKEIQEHRGVKQEQKSGSHKGAKYASSTRAQRKELERAGREAEIRAESTAIAEAPGQKAEEKALAVSEMLDTSLLAKENLIQEAPAAETENPAQSEQEAQEPSEIRIRREDPTKTVKIINGPNSPILEFSTTEVATAYQNALASIFQNTSNGVPTQIEAFINGVRTLALAYNNKDGSGNDRVNFNNVTIDSSCIGSTNEYICISSANVPVGIIIKDPATVEVAQQTSQFFRVLQPDPESGQVIIRLAVSGITVDGKDIGRVTQSGVRNSIVQIIEGGAVGVQGPGMDAPEIFAEPRTDGSPLPTPESPRVTESTISTTAVSTTTKAPTTTTENTTLPSPSPSVPVSPTVPASSTSAPPASSSVPPSVSASPIPSAVPSNEPTTEEETTTGEKSSSSSNIPASSSVPASASPSVVPSVSPSANPSIPSSVFPPSASASPTVPASPSVVQSASPSVPPSVSASASPSASPSNEPTTEEETTTGEKSSSSSNIPASSSAPAVASPSAAPTASVSAAPSPSVSASPSASPSPSESAAPPQNESTTASTTTTATTTTTSTSTTTTQSNNGTISGPGEQHENDPNKAEKNSSAGTTAAIAGGAGVGAVLLAALIAIRWKRRVAKAKTADNQLGGELVGNIADIYELDSLHHREDNKDTIIRFEQGESKETAITLDEPATLSGVLTPPRSRKAAFSEMPLAFLHALREMPEKDWKFKQIRQDIFNLMVRDEQKTIAELIFSKLPKEEQEYYHELELKQVYTLDFSPQKHIRGSKSPVGKNPIFRADDYDNVGELEQYGLRHEHDPLPATPEQGSKPAYTEIGLASNHSSPGKVSHYSLASPEKDSAASKDGSSNPYYSTASSSDASPPKEETYADANALFRREGGSSSYPLRKQLFKEKDVPDGLNPAFIDYLDAAVAGQEGAVNFALLEEEPEQGGDAEYIDVGSDPESKRSSTQSSPGGAAYLEPDSDQPQRYDDSKSASAKSSPGSQERRDDPAYATVAELDPPPLDGEKEFNAVMNGLKAVANQQAVLEKFKGQELHVTASEDAKVLEPASGSYLEAVVGANREVGEKDSMSGERSVEAATTLPTSRSWVNLLTFGFLDKPKTPSPRQAGRAVNNAAYDPTLPRNPGDRKQEEEARASSASSGADPAQRALPPVPPSQERPKVEDPYESMDSIREAEEGLRSVEALPAQQPVASAIQVFENNTPDIEKLQRTTDERNIETVIVNGDTYTLSRRVKQPIPAAEEIFSGVESEGLPVSGDGTEGSIGHHADSLDPAYQPPLLVNRLYDTLERPKSSPNSTRRHKKSVRVSPTEEVNALESQPNGWTPHAQSSPQSKSRQERETHALSSAVPPINSSVATQRTDMRLPGSARQEEITGFGDEGLDYIEPLPKDSDLSETGPQGGKPLNSPPPFLTVRGGVPVASPPSFDVVPLSQSREKDGSVLHQLKKAAAVGEKKASLLDRSFPPPPSPSPEDDLDAYSLELLGKLRAKEDLMGTLKQLVTKKPEDVKNVLNQLVQQSPRRLAYNAQLRVADNLFQQLFAEEGLTEDALALARRVHEEVHQKTYGKQPVKVEKAAIERVYEGLNSKSEPEREAMIKHLVDRGLAATVTDAEAQGQKVSAAHREQAQELKETSRKHLGLNPKSPQKSVQKDETSPNTSLSHLVTSRDSRIGKLSPSTPASSWEESALSRLAGTGQHTSF